MSSISTVMPNGSSARIDRAVIRAASLLSADLADPFRCTGVALEPAVS